MLRFSLYDAENHAHEIEPEFDTLAIAGWAMRDAQKIADRKREVQTMGIEPPRNAPVFWRVSPDHLVNDEQISVLGITTVGEVEVVLLGTSMGTLVTIGSDHTDRHLEGLSVAHAKQICAKPVATACWYLSDVADTWDDLVVRAWSIEGGVRSLYQEGTLDQLLNPDELVRRYLGHSGTLPIGTALFCGTMPVRGEIGLMERLEIELEDKARRRSLFHGYDIVVIPTVT